MKKSYLFYDGACPFCNQYTKFKELRECIDLELCDARQNMLWKESNPRLNLDDGIILLLEDGTILQGDCSNKDRDSWKKSSLPSTNNLYPD